MLKEFLQSNGLTPGKKHRPAIYNKGIFKSRKAFKKPNSSNKSKTRARRPLYQKLKGHLLKKTKQGLSKRRYIPCS
jgi:hypothetical protein